MVQNLSNPTQNQYGTINKIGSTAEGRVVYQIDDPQKQQSIRMSVAAKDCDTFERSYRQIIESAPKLQKYTESTPPEKIEKNQKIAKWLVIGCGLLGGLIPMLKVKGDGFLGVLKQVGLTLLGTGAGLGVGIFGASRLVTPPGVKEFSQASQALSKLDIKPVM